MIRRYLSLPSNFSIDISPSFFFSDVEVEYRKISFVRRDFPRLSPEKPEIQRRDEGVASWHEPDPYRTSSPPGRCFSKSIPPFPPPPRSFPTRFRSRFRFFLCLRGRVRFFRGRGGKERGGGNECEIIARNNGTKRAWHKGGPSLAADVYFRQLWELWCRAPLRLHAPIAY